MYLTENLTSAVMRDKGFDENKRQAILEILLRPHKHKHRKGQKPKSDYSFLETLIYPSAESTPKKNKQDSVSKREDDDDDDSDVTKESNKSKGKKQLEI